MRVETSNAGFLATSVRYGDAMPTIRPATLVDEPALGRYGAALMAQHHAVDPKRFLQADDAEAGYGRFLASRIEEDRGKVYVAEHEGRVIGYVYTDLEPTDWLALRGPCGVVYDLYVDESVRRLGAGRALLQAALDWIQAQGRSQVVLTAMTGNQDAQRLFESAGFRRTMIEMTLDRAQD